MKPLQISPETAITLSKQLGVPLEHLMHMPQHILLQKIAELSKKKIPHKLRAKMKRLLLGRTHNDSI